MKIAYPIGLAAGLASALLYASVLTGAVFSILLAYAAPLPLLIAGLGWGRVSAVTGIVSVTVLLSFTVDVRFAAVFLMWVGVPVALLVYLALLSREGDQPGTREWYPPGRLIIWICIISTALLGLTVLIGGPDLASFRLELKTALNKLIERSPQLKAYIVQQPELDVTRVVEYMVRTLPTISAGLWTISSFVNLWLAARIAQVSGKLERPWPELTDLSYPRTFAWVFAASVLGIFLPGIAGLLSSAFAAAGIFAFFLLGLTTVHAMTKGSPYRYAILGTVYAIVLFLGWAGIPLLVAAGFTECMIGLRRRLPRLGGGTGSV